MTYETAYEMFVAAEAAATKAIEAAGDAGREWGMDNTATLAAFKAMNAAIVAREEARQALHAVYRAERAAGHKVNLEA